MSSDLTTVLVDQDHMDSEINLALMEMRRELDRQIGAQADGWARGQPEASLRRLLVFRYGQVAERAKRRSREPVSACIARAFISSKEPHYESLDGQGRYYLIRCDLGLATEWYRAALDREWPTGLTRVRFMAEDLHTMWVALRALRLAPLRPDRHASQPADDPFPAPHLLITGETGTGKELLAEAVHARSARCDKEFGRLNCGGLPTNLVESELFGHRKGAFTGAVSNYDGFLWNYRESSVLLDEIGDTEPQTQVRLLRFLNSGEIRQVGAASPRGQGPLPRVIAATRQPVDLWAQEDPSRFRKDLLYRVAARRLRLRPLCDPSRRSSIPRLLNRSLEMEAERRGVPPPVLSAAAGRAAQAYSWPGNMREMRDLAESLLSDQASRDDFQIALVDLPQELHRAYAECVPQPERYGLQIPERLGGSRTRLSEAVAIEAIAMMGADDPHEARRLKAIAELLERVGVALGVEATTEQAARAAEAKGDAAADRVFLESWLPTFAQAVEVAFRPLDAVHRAALVSIETHVREGHAGVDVTAADTPPPATLIDWLLRPVVPALQVMSEDDFAGVCGLVELIALKPVQPLARLLGRWLSERTAADGRRLVGEVMHPEPRAASPRRVLTVTPSEDTEEPASRGEEEPDAGESGAPAPDWKSIQNDREALEEAIERFGGVSALAGAIGMRRETVSRRRSALLRERHDDS